MTVNIVGSVGLSLIVSFLVYECLLVFGENLGLEHLVLFGIGAATRVIVEYCRAAKRPPVVTSPVSSSTRSCCTSGEVPVDQDGVALVEEEPGCAHIPYPGPGAPTTESPLYTTVSSTHGCVGPTLCPVHRNSTCGCRGTRPSPLRKIK